MPVTEKGLIYVLALVGIFFIREGYQDIKDTKANTAIQLAALKLNADQQLNMTKAIVNRLDEMSAKNDQLELTVKGIEGSVLYYAGISKSRNPNKVVLGINTPKGDQFQVESELSNVR